MSKFDLTSDIHVDFWIGVNNSPQKQQKNMHTLISKLLPDTPSDTLVIAGDLGHYNHQNKLFIEVLKQFYKNIVLVHGNHDFYMVSASVRKNFSCDSFARLNDMIDLCNKIPDVHYLSGNVVDIDGIKFGGTGMWYDDSYAINDHYFSPMEIRFMWETYMNDSVLISNPNGAGKPNGFDRYLFVEEQKKLMDNVASIGCDVYVSHICPTSKFFPPHYCRPESTFYQFDGNKYLNQLDETKIWCYGHTHETRHDIDSSGCRLLCNPLGYPSNSLGDNWMQQKFPNERKFFTVDTTPLVSYDELFGGADA